MSTTRTFHAQSIVNDLSIGFRAGSAATMIDTRAVAVSALRPNRKSVVFHDWM
jgi:hypothetical protein